MALHDDTLLSALSEASEGKGVLVIVEQADLISTFVLRATASLIGGLRRHGGWSQDQARGFITPSNNPWRINLRSGGWVFFYPSLGIKPTDDFGKPICVFAENEKRRYERLTYNSWKASFPPPPEGDAVQENQVEEPPKSVWERLLEDD